MADRVPFSTHGFSLVVCRNFDGRWLAVKETRNRGWWLPAGLVDPGESYFQAAHREAYEEARIRIHIKGILRIEHSVYGPTHARMRVVFFAMPTDNGQEPKNFPDKESEEARWVTLDELKKLARTPPGLRGPELYEWGSYIEKGGAIAPVHFLCREDEPIPSPTAQPQLTFPRETTESQLVSVDQMIDSIERGEENILQRYILQGGDVNLTLNDRGWTPLHLACRLGKEGIVRLLLLAGASIDALTHKKRTVLHFAANSSTEIAMMTCISLMGHPNAIALINQQDIMGDTPLHFAASTFGRGVVWEMLERCGADSSYANVSGLTPLDIVNQISSDMIH